MRSPNAAKPRLKHLGLELQLVQIDARARQQAAAVLEVLTGLRTPQQAADDLGLTLPTYFNLETRALRGLTFACCALPPGRQHSLAPRLRQAQERVADLEKQLGRYQALLRTAQRNIGLPPSPPPKPRAGDGRKAKKPAIRALRTIQAIRQADAMAAAHAPTASTPPSPASAPIGASLGAAAG